jgi:hypothetical protein
MTWEASDMRGKVNTDIPGLELNPEPPSSIQQEFWKADHVRMS